MIHHFLGVRPMPAGKFKARCLSVMDGVNATGEPVIITKRGTPVAKIVPVTSKKQDLFGFMVGQFKIRREYRISHDVSRGVGGNAEMTLLDTHVLIWLASEPSNLSRKASDAIRRASQETGIAIHSQVGGMEGIAKTNLPSRSGPIFGGGSTSIKCRSEEDAKLPNQLREQLL